MKTILLPLLLTLLDIIQSPAPLKLEVLAQRQQLSLVANRDSKRFSYCKSERIFWVWFYRMWPECIQTLMIFKPDTLPRWHRKGFQLHWTWKSRPNLGGRPAVDPNVRKLIRKISKDNIGWGAPRIHGELKMPGIRISESTVAKYMIHHRKPPSQNWRTFLDNHTADLVSADFFTVPTITFRVLYVFVILSHCRREIIHFNVTEHPTAQWTAQQLNEAFPFDSAPRYLLRDRDNIYGDRFRDRVKSLGIEEVISAPRSPWQNPYVERTIGSIRRECLNHLIIINKRHLRQRLKSYQTYYHDVRTHLSLDKQSPVPRSIESSEQRKIVAIAHVGGLHHEYRHAA
jgi:transposase InsO family protein